jgi:hypothetical protein
LREFGRKRCAQAKGWWQPGQDICRPRPEYLPEWGKCRILRLNNSSEKQKSQIKKKKKTILTRIGDKGHVAIAASIGNRDITRAQIDTVVLRHKRRSKRI